jgi:hypothetical protein
MPAATMGCAFENCVFDKVSQAVGIFVFIATACVDSDAIIEHLARGAIMNASQSVWERKYVVDIACHQSFNQKSMQS